MEMEGDKFSTPRQNSHEIEHLTHRSKTSATSQSAVLKKTPAKRKKNSFSNSQLATRRGEQSRLQDVPKFSLYRAKSKHIPYGTTLKLQEADPTHPIWLYFGRYEDKELSSYCCCLACVKNAEDLSVSERANINFSVTISGSNTSHPEDHLRIYHSDLYIEYFAKKNIDDTMNPDGTGTITQFLSNDRYNTKIHKAVLKWVVMCNVPFSMVQEESFREMMSIANPKVPNLNRQTLAKKIQDTAMVTKAKLASMLRSQFLAVTTDGWTSSNSHHFVAVTCHFITDNDFALKSAILACQSHSGSSQAEDHMALISNVLNDYEIPMTNVVGIVSDTEATMGKFGRLIESDHNVPWLGCIDHRLQLVTKVCWTQNATFSNTLDKARALVGAFSHSTQATDQLQAYQQEDQKNPLMLVKDIATRWWSTYSMASRLVRLRKYVDLCITNHFIHQSYGLNNTEWGILDQLLLALEPFQFFQQILEGEYYVTLSLVPAALDTLREGLMEMTDEGNMNFDAVVDLATRMLEKFNKEFGSPEGISFYDAYSSAVGNERRVGIPKECLLATAMDPRSKNLVGVPNDGSIEKIWGEIEKRAIAIQKKLQPSTPAAVTAPALSVPQANGSSAYLLKFAQRLGNAPLPSPPTAAVDPEDLARNIVRNEINAYKADPGISLTDIDLKFTNPLEWWKDNEKKYPILSILARRILCITATSAPSERLFSAAGLTITNDRCNLLPQHAESAIFLRGNWKLTDI
jgi:hypothetical protein